VLMNWHIRQNAESEDFYRTQVAEIVTPRTLSLLPKLRLIVDKSVKRIDPSCYMNLGFSDAQLIICLQAGLSRINAAQPYVSWQSIDVFPLDTYWEILTRSALLYALTSQAIFAIDTDVPAFNDASHSFTLSHYAQLKGMLDSLSSTLDADIRAMKMHFVASGSIISQLSLGWGFYQMLASSPPGSLFRNTYSNL